MTNITLLEILILQSLTKEKSYPCEIFKLLKNKGVDIKLYSTYNCLEALEKKEYVKTILKDNGKFYRITAKGIDLLERIEYINSLFLTKQ